MADEQDQSTPGEANELANLPANDSDDEQDTGDDEGDDVLDLDAEESDDDSEDDDGESEDDESDDEAGDEDDGDDSDEVVTITHDGKAYQVPKALESQFMMQSDYTRKTQEVAEHRRSLEQRQQALEQQEQMSDQEIEARVALKTLDQRLEQYGKVDWRQLRQQDPAAYDEHWSYYQELKDKRGQATGFLQQQEQKRTQETTADRQQRLTETKEYALKNIKGWDPALDAKITDFAIGQGMTPEFIEQSVNPLLYGLLYKAYVGEQAMTRASTKKPAKQQTKPLKTVKAKSNPKGASDLGSADMSEYVAIRQRQMRKTG